MSIDNLRKLILELLGPQGCPWDREQTPRTISDYILEEAHELAWAIQKDDAAEACEELGDVLFLLIFLSMLYEEKKAFTLEDALTRVHAKMVRRHPHVFDNVTVKSQEDIFRNWERIKRREKAMREPNPARGDQEGLFYSLPKDLDALLMAYRIHSKAARVGFTWASDQAAEEQLAAEWREWKDAEKNCALEQQEEEFGDLLFTLVELGRRRGLKANTALTRANIKFLDRFAKMEKKARDKGLSLDQMTPDEMNALWDEAKRG